MTTDPAIPGGHFQHCPMLAVLLATVFAPPVLPSTHRQHHQRLRLPFARQTARQSLTARAGPNGNLSISVANLFRTVDRRHSGSLTLQSILVSFQNGKRTGCCIWRENIWHSTTYSLGCIFVCCLCLLHDVFSDFVATKRFCCDSVSSELDWTCRDSGCFSIWVTGFNSHHVVNRQFVQWIGVDGTLPCHLPKNITYWHTLTQLAHWVYNLLVFWFCGCPRYSLLSSQLFWLSVHFVINMEHPCPPGVFSDINSKSYEELLMMHRRRIHEASDSGPCVGYHGCPCPNKCKFLRGRSCCTTCIRLSSLERKVALLQGALQFPKKRTNVGYR